MSRAFTLLEVLVVVVLLGLTATAVAVSVRGTMEPARLRAATLQLEGTLALGRDWTRQHHSPAWLQLELGSGRYRLVRGDLQTGAGAWQALAGVIVQHASAGESTNPAAQQLFALRIAPSGVTLPWSAELRAGTLSRTIGSDGFSRELDVREDAKHSEGQKRG